MSSQFIPGTYVCEVLEQGLGETKTGKDQLIFKFRVMERIQHDADGNETFIPDEFQTEAMCYQVISPDSEKAMKYLMSCLRYAGFEGDDFAEMNFVGSSVRFKVDADEYNGVVRDRWGMCPPPMIVKPLDSKGSRKLNALFGRQLKEQPGAKQSAPPKQQAAPAATQAAPEVPADENPF